MRLNRVDYLSEYQNAVAGKDVKACHLTGFQLVPVKNLLVKLQFGELDF
jgi:hypothetical protein